MADIPAGWYDDPETPGQHRYWDGTAWTDHRAPKAPTGPERDGPSPWSIVADTFAVLGRHWREFVVLTAPLLVVNIAVTLAVVRGFQRALNVGITDFVDRVTTPGFNPSDGGADEAFIDSIRFSVDGTSIALWVGAGLLAVLGSALWSIAIARVTVAASCTTPPDAATAYRAALTRLPRLLGLLLALFAAWVVAAFSLAILAALVPLTLLLTIPAMFGAAIWAAPVISAASLTIAAAPRDQPAWSSAVGLLKNRWWAYVGRLALVVVVVVAVGFGTGVVTGPFLAASLWGGLMVNGLLQLVQNVIGVVGVIQVYLWAGGAVDPELRVGASPR